MNFKIQIIKLQLFFIILLLSCNANNNNKSNIDSNLKTSIIIPFQPSSCHQCYGSFGQNLRNLEENNLEYTILLSEDYSEDLEYIKKEYGLNKHKIKNYLFSSNLFNKYYVYEQNYVLQFDNDSSYKIFDNAKNIINELKQINEVEKIELNNGYVISKSAFNLFNNGIKEFCITNTVQQNAFDYINNANKQNSKISLADSQIYNNFLLNFKQPILAKEKYDEVKNISDIPNKNAYNNGIFYYDTFFIMSNHTYINNLIDSTLGGFQVINIYKDGKYLNSRSIDENSLPKDFVCLSHFTIYDNKLYCKLVNTNNYQIDKPNYFIAKFNLVKNSYKFEKMLNFTIPEIHKDVGYTFLELKFSGKYFMTSISNKLFNLETEEVENLKIPTNSKVTLDKIMDNCKGVDIVIDNINYSFPNLIITYFHKDENGKGSNVVMNYNVNKNKITGITKFPLENTTFIKPDNLNFGYYLWSPLKEKNTYFYYKKLF